MRFCTKGNGQWNSFIFNLFVIINKLPKIYPNSRCEWSKFQQCSARVSGGKLKIVNILDVNPVTQAQFPALTISADLETRYYSK